MAEKIKRRIPRIAALLLTIITLLPFAQFSGAAVYSDGNDPLSEIIGNSEEAFMKSTYDFTANWIWNRSDNGQGNRWMIFRKDIELDEKPEKVTARIAADTKYWLYINGEEAVYEGQLKRGAALLKKDIYTKDNPGQPDLSKMLSEVATYYDEVDITKYLKSGKNTITALVWYFGNEGHSHVGSGKGGFLFEADIAGNKVISDGSWKTSRHEGYQPSEGIGGFAQEYHIIYDARKGFDSFADPDFDVSGWESAKVIGKAGDKPWNELWKRTIPGWRVWDIAAFKPDDTENVTSQGKGKYRLKLPTNIQFAPYVRVNAPAGKTIRMSSPNSGNTSVTYITKGGENGESIVQEFESLTWINWWFVDFEIPDGVEVIELGYRQSGYDTDFDGSFVCDDDFFNTLWIKARDTAYVNIRDTFMDCPDRERAPWLGDAVNEMQIAYYSMSPTVYAAVRKDIATRVNWQNSDGIIPSTAPATFRYNEYAELSGQSLAGVMSWFDYYLWSGDIETLRASYPALQAYIATFDLDTQNFTDPFVRGSGTNTMHINWIDWGPNMDQQLVLNIWAYIGVDTLCKYAKELNDAENLTVYTALRDSMRSKFDSMFWNGREFRSSSYSGAADDRGQALAVFAGLATPDKYPALRKILLKNQFASPYMVKYSIEALYMMGYTADAEKRMRESYANDVPLSDPTFSESWGGGGSKNHGWSGGGLIALSGYAAGVRPLEAGFGRYTVIPQMSSINSIDAVIPTLKGNIAVSASKRDGHFELSTNVLEGSKARIGLPRTNARDVIECRGVTVWENGSPVDAVNGLKYLSCDDNFIYFEAEEGEWSFTVSEARKVSKDKYALEITCAGGGTVELDGERITLPYKAQIGAGSEITVKALPSDGFVFECFSGSVGSKESEMTLVVDGDMTVNAGFVRKYSIDGCFLEIKGFSQGGELFVNGRAVSEQYRYVFVKGSRVTVRAKSSEDFSFEGWKSGNKVISESEEFELTLDGNTKLEALFKSMLGDNLAKGKKAAVSSSVDNHMFNPKNLTDGVYTVKDVNEGWTSLETSAVQWFYIDLGKVATFDTIKLYPRHNGTDNGYGIPINLEILVSDDHENWTTVAKYKNIERIDSGAHTFTFGKQSARYVKLNGSKLRQNPFDGNRLRFQVAEIEIFNALAGEVPADQPGQTTGAMTGEPVTEEPVTAPGGEQNETEAEKKTGRTLITALAAAGGVVLAGALCALLIIRSRRRSSGGKGKKAE